MRVGIAALACAVALVLCLPAGAGAYVFWAGGGTIGRVDNNGGSARPGFIIGAELAPIAIDSSHLYYTTEEEDQMGALAVARTNLEGGESTLLQEGFPG